MENKCRTGRKRIAILVVMLLTMMSILTACGFEGAQYKSHYELDVVDHTHDFYVNDFAGVFSEEEKNKLMTKAVNFDEEYSGIQVVITTVESLDSAVSGYEYVVEDNNGNRVDESELKKPSGTPRFTIEQVAYSMYSEYAIGQNDMGILILFSTGDREVRIETGRQMQFYITDSMSGRLLDNYGMKYFAEDRFAEGLISVQTAVINEIESSVPINWLESSQKQNREDKVNATTVAPTEGATKENSEENVTVTTVEENKENDSGKGLLFGFFSSIIAACAAVAAFIRQKFKGKSQKESFEKAKQEEINSLKISFQKQLDERDRVHEVNASAIRIDFERIIREKNEQIQELNENLSNAENQVSTLTTQLEDMTEMFDRAQRLHPEHNFNEEIREMIEGEHREAAKAIDCELAKALETPPNKDNYDVFNRAIFMFDSTQSEVKKYLTSDKTKLEALYEEAVKMKQDHEKMVQEENDRAAAKRAHEMIKEACDKNPIGSHKNFKILDEAYNAFLNLTTAEKVFFPDCKLISELERLHRSAENDHNDYEAARRAESNIERIICGMHSADEDDRDKLERAMRYYRTLSDAQKAYFSEELLRKLKKLLNEAEDDHRRQERKRADDAAAARRRAQQRNSSSSYTRSHRSSFSGRGGRPSGGGASRKF